MIYYCLSKPQGVCIGVVVSGICILSQIDHYGKKHDVESNKTLDSTKGITGCLVFVGCAAVIYLVPITIIHLYATKVWKEQSKLYLYLVSD